MAIYGTAIPMSERREAMSRWEEFRALFRKPVPPADAVELIDGEEPPVQSVV